MLNVIMWIVAGVSLIGTVLNVYKRRGGFAVWAVTDVAWVAYDLSIGANAQAALLAIYGAMAVWGFLKWRDNGSERDALSRLAASGFKALPAPEAER